MYSLLHSKRHGYYCDFITFNRLRRNLQANRTKRRHQQHEIASNNISTNSKQELYIMRVMFSLQMELSPPPNHCSHPLQPMLQPDIALRGLQLGMELTQPVIHCCCCMFVQRYDVARTCRAGLQGCTLVTSKTRPEPQNLGKFLPSSLQLIRLSDVIDV